MALKKQISHLDDYYQRLLGGNAKKIKPQDVEHVIAKLAAKEAALIAELDKPLKNSDRIRIEQKLLVAHEHQERAQWLLAEITAARH